jgi:hypothetical protein
MTCICNSPLFSTQPLAGRAYQHLPNAPRQVDKGMMGRLRLHVPLMYITFPTNNATSHFIHSYQILHQHSLLYDPNTTHGYYFSLHNISLHNEKSVILYNV